PTEGGAVKSQRGGRQFGLVLAAAVGALVAWGTIWPIPPAKIYLSGEEGRSGSTWLMHASRNPEEAVRNLASQISLKDFRHAYDSLANKDQFTEFEFEHDVLGYYPSLRTQATLDGFEVFPLHSSADTAEMQLKLHWTTVVGAPVESRNLKVVRVGDQWKVDWPIILKPNVPAQVIAEDFQRWSVVLPGAGDVLGRTDRVASSYVKIVDMHPVQRAEGLVVLGEVRNDDSAPVNVSVVATLLSQDQKTLASEGCFDSIDHILLPGQVTPFRIMFPNQQLSKVANIRMDPSAILVSAPTGPKIAVQNEKINPAPDASLSGELINPTGNPISVVHIVSALYDQKGDVVWMVDKYLDRALYPQTPTPFDIPIPEDLARKISSQRTMVASFDYGGTI
ncbi:MAG TPA: hypothetical protein VJ728_05115, partial [Candidatus Binataceae bacterium]|nr:hypothetical protein [Candidatus Binataceae bacterium]